MLSKRPTADELQAAEGLRWIVRKFIKDGKFIGPGEGVYALIEDCFGTDADKGKRSWFKENFDVVFFPADRTLKEERKVPAGGTYTAHIAKTNKKGEYYFLRTDVPDQSGLKEAHDILDTLIESARNFLTRETGKGSHKVKASNALERKDDFFLYLGQNGIWARIEEKARQYSAHRLKLSDNARVAEKVRLDLYKDQLRHLHEYSKKDGQNLSLLRQALGQEHYKALQKHPLCAFIESPESLEKIDDLLDALNTKLYPSDSEEINFPVSWLLHPKGLWGGGTHIAVAQTYADSPALTNLSQVFAPSAGNEASDPTSNVTAKLTPETPAARAKKLKDVQKADLNPLTATQLLAMTVLEDPAKKVVALVGQSGSGKSLLPIAYAVGEALAGRISKFTVIRPKNKERDTVPGDDADKREGEFRPLDEDFMIATNNTASRQKLEELGICQTLHPHEVSGATLGEIIIIDEAQKLAADQLEDILNRVNGMNGNGKIIITGDIGAQLRLGDLEVGQEPALIYFVNAFGERILAEPHSEVSEMISIIGFKPEDAIRNPFAALLHDVIVNEGSNEKKAFASAAMSQNIEVLVQGIGEAAQRAQTKLAALTQIAWSKYMKKITKKGADIAHLKELGRWPFDEKTAPEYVQS